LLSLLRALAKSSHRYTLALMAAGLLAVVLANTFGQIKLNAWHGAFYDALEQKSLPALGNQIVAFLVIAGGLLFLVVGQTWLQEHIKVRLREWLTHELLDQWLAPKRAYRLTQTGESGANPDQYIQADARHLAETSATLAFGLLQCTLLLVSFVGVLWALSSNVVFTYDGSSFTIPGYMVWCALGYAAAGSFLTWLVGRPLIKLNAERYAREADLRFAIVRVNESSEAITLQRGEGDERRLMDNPISNVILLSRQLAGGLARLTWVTSGYGWLGLIVPVLVALPGYFGGGLTFGGLMMVAGAFNQVQNSLRWFVDNFAGIADWRATLLRVARFRDNLTGLDKTPATPGMVAIEAHPHGRFAFAGLRIETTDGASTLDAQHLHVGPGERVLISTGVTAERRGLLRAIAGLAAKGSGTISLPDAKHLALVSPHPYLPTGTLICAIAYPFSCAQDISAPVSAALQRVGLDHLASRLEDRERWDKALSLEEQQRAGIARLLVHRPRWIIVEDCLTSMGEANARLLRSILSHELAGSAVIGIGDGRACLDLYERTVALRNRDVIRLEAITRARGLPRLVAAE